MAGPEAVPDCPDVAGRGDGDSVLSGWTSIDIAPEVTIGIPLLIVIGGNGPRTGRDDEFSSPGNEFVSERFPSCESVGANHDPDRPEGGLRNGVGVIPGAVEIVGEFEFVDFAVGQEALAVFVKENCCVIESVACSFGEPGANQDGMSGCGLGERVEGR